MPNNSNTTMRLNQKVDYPIKDRQKIGRMLHRAGDVIDDTAKHSVEEVAQAIVHALENDITFRESWGTLKAEPPEKGANKNTEVTP